MTTTSRLDDLCPACGHERFYHVVWERHLRRITGCTRCLCPEEMDIELITFEVVPADETEVVP